MLMRLRIAVFSVILATFALPATAEYAGYHQRVYLEKTYLIYPWEYHGPVWYAGDGRVVFGNETRRSSARARNSADARLPAGRAY
jgi:hypothetical protein